MNSLFVIFIQYSIKILSRLPLSVLYILSDFLYFILFYVVKYRRSVTAGNLSKSFPDKSAVELLEIEKKYYHFMTDLIIESIKGFTISKKELQRRFKIKNPELLQQYLDSGKSVLVYASHYGNWEWSVQIVPAILLDLGSYSLWSVYKPQSNKYFENLINRVRARFGGNMVAMKAVPKTLLQLQKVPYAMVFASDQTPVAGETQYFTTFMNQETAVFMGVEKLAQKFNNPVLYWHVNCVKRGCYEGEFIHLFENPRETTTYQITNAYNQFLEKCIREQPAYWMWSHKRWKFKKENIPRMNNNEQQ